MVIDFGVMFRMGLGTRRRRRRVWRCARVGDGTLTASPTGRDVCRRAGLGEGHDGANARTCSIVKLSMLGRDQTGEGVIVYGKAGKMGMHTGFKVGVGADAGYWILDAGCWMLDAG